MFATDIVDKSDSSNTIIILVLSLMAVAGFVFFKQPLSRSLISKRFCYLMVFICFIVFFHSLFVPLTPRNLYLFIPLPLLLFYYFRVITQSLQKDSIILWSITVVFLLLVLYFFTNYYANVDYDTEHQQNGSYLILYLFPFLLCHKNTLIRFLFIGVILVVVVFSLKRGGFVALVSALAVYFWISQVSFKSRKKRYLGYLILVIVVFAIFGTIQYLNDNVLDGLLMNRIESMDETGGAGRLDIYSYYLSFISKDSVVNWIVGHGWYGSIRSGTIGFTCHNDFLEAFIDFGVFGFLLYASFFMALFKYTLKLIKVKHPYAPAMGASVAIFFVNSMVSHILIYPKCFIVFALFWGFVVSSTSMIKEYQHNNFSR